jgi:hypothetical protein
MSILMSVVRPADSTGGSTSSEEVSGIKAEEGEGSAGKASGSKGECEDFVDAKIEGEGLGSQSENLVNVKVEGQGSVGEAIGEASGIKVEDEGEAIGKASGIKVEDEGTESGIKVEGDVKHKECKEGHTWPFMEGDEEYIFCHLKFQPGTRMFEPNC